MQLREYQRESVDAIYSYFAEQDGHPLVVMPTGSGKSVVLAAFIKETLEHWPDQRIMVLTHVKELIQQNYLELVGHWPLAPAGIFSAGLKRREAQAQILFAGIQSVHGKTSEIGSCDLILIDECHLVPRTSDTMYRRFLDEMTSTNDQIKVVGFTATHYRLDSGLLTDGEDRVFTDVAFEVSVKRLLEEKWLAPLITKAPATTLDVSGVHTRGGEFIPSELAAAVDKEEINACVVREILHYGHNRKSWLLFCTGVDHAYHIRDLLRKSGIVAETVTGDTNDLERMYILDEFKAGRVRAVTNCDILTTGFNHPGIDLIAFLRPTQSTGLYVQMAGRGMRNAPGKTNCIVLDFAGNIKRHGPIDRVNPNDSSHNGKGEAPVKTCPKCQSVIFAGFRSCPDCGYEFPPPETVIKPTASARPIISQSAPFWVKVERIRYERHRKLDKPDSLRVIYYESTYTSYSEWVCFEHGGTVANRAKRWWMRRGGDPAVSNVTEALRSAIDLMQPTHILVKEDGKFWRVMQHRYDEFDSPPVDVEREYYDTEYEPVVEGEMTMEGDEDDDLPF